MQQNDTETLHVIKLKSAIWAYFFIFDSQRKCMKNWLVTTTVGVLKKKRFHVEPKNEKKKEEFIN